MNFKKLTTAILAGVMALSVTMADTQAASREEIAAIKVSKSGNFKYWTKDAESKNKLIAYVKDITNKKSKNFIPVEDRIAVFDMDGTFLCETAPNYFDHMLYLHRAKYDKNFTANKSDLDFANAFESSLRDKNSEVKLESSAPHQASVFSGMTEAELKKYAEDYMQTNVEGLSNLKWGEAFYLPMVEVIKYLQKNDFKVYVVSGTDRQIVRALIGDMLGIPTNQVIGTDVKILANDQGDTDGLKYTYGKDNYLIRGDLVVKDVQMNKVIAIAREIGKQPVLAFGNSSGDTSMLNYTINKNKYRSAAFFVICDDLERELGNTKKAESCIKLSDKNGWTSISMRDDWKTIYGDNVKRTN